MIPSEPTIDLNADLGEGCPWDELLLARVTSASISCGAHAGDPETIERTLREAKARDVAVGRIPATPIGRDSAGASRDLNRDEVTDLILFQVATLKTLATDVGVPIRFLKPHGALYNQAQRDTTIASGVVAAADQLGLPILGQPGSEVETLCRKKGMRFLVEGFADRRYRPDGRLVPRSDPTALLHDPREIEEQLLRLIDQGIATLCIHGDDPGAIALADRVLSVLKRAGIGERTGSEVALLVVHPGHFTTVQDLGRPGYREWGVPVAGVFDRSSADSPTR